MDGAMNITSDLKRKMLRHTVATLVYRGAKTVSNAPEDFAEFRVNETTRSPGEILAYIGNLLDWALCVAKGEHVYKNPLPCRGKKK